MRPTHATHALLWLALLTQGCSIRTPAEVRVGAAASTARVFEALAAEGLTVRPAFASSGLIARQLEQGAPFDVFIAADAESVDRVVRAGVCDGATRRTWAVGRLVIISRPGVPLPEGLEALRDARYAHISMANPETAPYGRAARQALTARGLLPEVQARLVPADNVLQAVQFVDSGNADVGLVSRSLLASDRPMVVVDAALHEPVALTLVLCGRAPSAEAKAFVDALFSARTEAILSRFGYDLPRGEVRQ